MVKVYLCNNPTIVHPRQWFKLKMHLIIDAIVDKNVYNIYFSLHQGIECIIPSDAFLFPLKITSA